MAYFRHDYALGRILFAGVAKICNHKGKRKSTFGKCTIRFTNAGRELASCAAFLCPNEELVVVIQHGLLGVT